MSVQHARAELTGAEEVGQAASTVDPVEHGANIRTAWQAAAPLWPAWFDTLEAEEGVR
jgi:hypothetical protein